MNTIVLGIDGLDSDLLFNNISLFKNFESFVTEGATGTCNCYACGYGSIENWVTYYTGLSAKSLGFYNCHTRDNEPISYKHYCGHQPFWQVLNQKGYRVGIFNGFGVKPIKIDGYITANCSGEDASLAFDKQCRDLYESLSKKHPKQFIPKTPEQLGYTWSEIYNNHSILAKILDENLFMDGILEYLQQELDYLLCSVKELETISPVDLLFVYTPTLDLISHFQLHQKDRSTILNAMQKLNDFAKELEEYFKPDNFIVLSDHGFISLADRVAHHDINMQKKAFLSREKAVFLDKDTIIMPGNNNSFLSGTHELAGVFLAKGKSIKKAKLSNFRVQDFYPFLLELFNIPCPFNREGVIFDMFNKDIIVNKNMMFNELNDKQKICIFQTADVSRMTYLINEVYLNNRDALITLFCKQEFAPFFLANKRISEVRIVEEGQEIDVSDFDYLVNDLYLVNEGKLQFIKMCTRSKQEVSWKNTLQ